MPSFVNYGTMMCGADNSTATVAVTVNNVKTMRHIRSTTMAANRQSFVTCAKGIIVKIVIGEKASSTGISQPVSSSESLSVNRYRRQNRYVILRFSRNIIINNGIYIFLKNQLNVYENKIRSKYFLIVD